jgi:hypothetical protein
MTPENFVYWLQGYFEINDAAGSGISSVAPGTIRVLSNDQLQVIKDHLKLVIKKQTPKGHYTSGIAYPSGPPVYYSHHSPPASC